MKSTILLCLAMLGQAAVVSASTEVISPEKMQQIYEEVKTPFDYGIVLKPSTGKTIDCGTVFRHGDAWYMIYVQQEPAPTAGYTTQLASSRNLLDWTPLGTLVDRGDSGTWDQAHVGGGVSFTEAIWGGSNTLRQHDGKYWLSFFGGANYGFETAPLHISVASTTEPVALGAWKKLGRPVLATTDADAGGDENYRMFKSNIIHDPEAHLGAPFVMFYNAQGSPGKGRTDERIFAATSQDMVSWKRYGKPDDANCILENPNPAVKRNVISGDPQVVRMDDCWVMFYFGAFWDPQSKVLNTFAVSRDLIHWTKWTGTPLTAPVERKLGAHKAWLIKHDGVVYHFYSSDAGGVRNIALMTSKNLREAP
ncbi:MAG: glycosylase [Verrucomicrobia bacterium]|nr:glycosylase [Verrucomicrobiota bacterium]